MTGEEIQDVLSMKDEDPAWLPYQAKLSELKNLMRALYNDREIYRHRCLELVKTNDAQAAEIQNLNKRLRARRALSA